MTQTERIDLACSILNTLNDVPITLLELIDRFKVGRNSVWYILHKFIKFKVVKVVKGANGFGYVKLTQLNDLQVRETLGIKPYIKRKIQECNTCFIKKFKIRKSRADSGSYLVKSVIMFVDDDDKEWKGNKCPECVIETLPSQQATPKRKCRFCSCVLPKTRYFYCMKCVSHMPDMLEDYSYHYDYTIHRGYKEEEEQLEDIKDNETSG